MSNDPSPQPTPDASASSPDGSVPPEIPNGGQSPALDGGSVIPDGAQSPDADVSASITTSEGVQGAKNNLKPKRKRPSAFRKVRAKVQHLQMQRLQKAEQPTPQEDRKRVVYELRLPWWQKAWRWTGLGDKNGWDWAQLLAVPIMLAIVTWGLGEYAKSRDQLQQQADKEKEEQQQKADKEKAQALADDKAKQDTLVKYLDDMAGSLKDGLLKAKPGDDKFIIAQSRTVLALQSLDKKRQQLVIQFLKASGLRGMSVDDMDTPSFLKELSKYRRGGWFGGPKPSDIKLGLLFQSQMEKANLANSDLSGAVLIGANLSGANLGCNPPDSKEPERCSDLSGADLRSAYLIRANLLYADLNSAKLIGAAIRGANLEGAFLTNAYLNGASLQDARLNGANLSGADLRYANVIKANFNEANLSNTNFTGAVLFGANLSGADLSNADLNSAGLISANLAGAILPHTDLAGTQDLTPQQLTGKDAPLLCNVRFPDYIKGIDPNRDCDLIPGELVKRYPKEYPDLQSAKNDVNYYRQLKFE